MKNEPSRLNLKRQATRAALVSAAKSLVFELPHQKTTIQDITHRAKLGLGTFYNYFETKNDVYQAVLDELRENFHDDLNQIRAPLVDPATIISVTIQYCLREAQDNKEWHEFIAFSGIKGEHILRQENEQSRRDVERGATTGRFKVENVEFTSQLITGMLNHITREIGRQRLSRDAIAETTRHILRMLGIPDPVAKSLTQRPLPPIAVPRKRTQIDANLFHKQELTSRT
ncbi:MAG: AcrR family transcriptional regulator [Flavobacterium sp.]|jgi:AcrR family transcriptional regulator